MLGQHTEDGNEKLEGKWEKYSGQGDSWANNATGTGRHLMTTWLVCFICSAIGFTTANQIQDKWYV